MRMSLRSQAGAAGVRTTHPSLPLLRMRVYDVTAIGTVLKNLVDDALDTILAHLDAREPLHVDVMCTHEHEVDGNISVHTIKWRMKIKHEDSWRTRVSNEQIKANVESVRRRWIERMISATGDELFHGPRFRYTPDLADGLKWRLLSDSLEELTGWSEVSSCNREQIRQALRTKLMFEPSVVSGWSIDGLRSNNYVEVDGNYFGPADGFDAVTWACRHEGHHVALSLPTIVNRYEVPALVEQTVNALYQVDLRANKIYHLDSVDAHVPPNGDTVHFTLNPTPQHPAAQRNHLYTRMLKSRANESGDAAD